MYKHLMSCEIEINHSMRLRLIINGFTRLILFRVFGGVAKNSIFSTFLRENEYTSNGFETFENLQVEKRIFNKSQGMKIVSCFYLRKKIKVSRCRQVLDNEYLKLFSASSNCWCFVVGHTHKNTHILYLQQAWIWPTSLHHSLHSFTARLCDFPTTCQIRKHCNWNALSNHWAW